MTSGLGVVPPHLQPKATRVKMLYHVHLYHTYLSRNFSLNNVMFVSYVLCPQLTDPFAPPPKVSNVSFTLILYFMYFSC